MYGISFKPLWIPSFSGIINRMELLTGTVPVNNFLLTGTGILKKNPPPPQSPP